MAQSPNSSRVIRTRLAALACGVLAALAFVVGVELVVPSQTAHDEGTNYGYLISGTKDASTAFVSASNLSDSLMVFGSSELSAGDGIINQVPSQVFGTANYGLQLSCVGEAFDQSLWHAIAAGAYEGANTMESGKAVLIVGLGWFTDGGEDGANFQTRFSSELYRQFLANDKVTDETKAYVRTRLADMGVDEGTLAADNADTPLDVANATVSSLVEDLKVRNGLSAVRSQGIPAPTGELTTPDWDALRAQALADATDAASNNDWGVENDFWESRLAPQLDAVADSRADETYSDTPEYDDLDCLLTVFDEVGVHPLVVMTPVMGRYYDHIGITQATRETCYQRVRDICASHQCTLADFSGNAYVRYYDFDIVHPGWLGWLDIEQAIYDYAKVGE